MFLGVRDSKVQPMETDPMRYSMARFTLKGRINSFEIWSCWLGEVSETTGIANELILCKLSGKLLVCLLPLPLTDAFAFLTLLPTFEAPLVSKDLVLNYHLQFNTV